MQDAEDEEWLLVAPAQESHTVSDSSEGDVEVGESSTREEPAAEAAAATEELRWRSPPPPPEAAAATEEATAAEEASTSEAAAARTDDVLHGLGEDLHQLQSEVADVEARLGRCTVSSSALKEIASAVPVLGGRVTVLETRMDAAAAAGAARQRRKELVQQAAMLSERVQLLPPLLAAKVAETAERHKAEGNEHYKRREYAAAIRCYTEAIGVQRSNPVFYSNRSSCHQAQGSWALGLADAKQSLALDVGFVKGYVHAVRCELQLGALGEAVATLQSAPLDLVGRPELKELGATLVEAAKAEGNAHFKAGKYEAAGRSYTLAIGLDGTQPVFFSNRSTVHQARREWREALADARKALKLDPLFAKGYLHVARCLLQQGAPGEAIEVLQGGLARLQEAGLQQRTPPLQELLRTIVTQPRQEGGGGAPSAAPAAAAAVAAAAAATTAASAAAASTASGAGGAGGAGRGAALKEAGNAMYRKGEYAEALRLYTQAIGAEPANGAYYGNRAACWLMLRKFERAANDCAEGLRQEGCAGLDKLRARQATALTHVGKLERAVDVLEEGVALRSGADGAPLRAQLEAARATQASLSRGRQALADEAWSAAKRHLVAAVGGGVTDEPAVHVELAIAHLALREHVEAAREAQLAISLDPDLLYAYVLRADALQVMGLTEKAIALLREGLQRDPDSTELAGRLKRLKRLVADVERAKAAVAAAMAARRFEEAIALCTEALRLDEDDRKLAAAFHDARAKAYQMLARSRGRGETRAAREAASGGGGGGGGGGGAGGARAAEEMAEAEDPRAGEAACWRRCLQDAGSAIYHEASLLRPHLLRAEALQGLERWGEAAAALEQCIASGPGAQERSVHEKLAHAQFLVRKAARPELYALLGCTAVGSAAQAKVSEKELRLGYKRAALECHPDRHVDKGPEARKEAEAKFKALGEALDVLADPFKRRLWDEGHDLESIAQHVQRRDQQAGGGTPGR